MNLFYCQGDEVYNKNLNKRGDRVRKNHIPDGTTSAESLASSVGGSVSTNLESDCPVLKKTLIFTNKNQSNNNIPEAVSDSTSKQKGGDDQTALQNFAKLTLGSKDQSVLKSEAGTTPKRRRKNKKTPVQVTKESEPSLEREVESSESEQKIDSLPLEESAMAPHPEPLNFRGGFTPSGRGSVNLPGSSNTTPQITDVSVKSSSSETLGGKTHAKAQILQRQKPANAAPSDNKNKNQNGLPTENRRSRQASNTSSQTSFQKGTGRLKLVNHVSSVFLSQVDPRVVTLLSNPCTFMGFNPYVIDSIPPHPFYFNLFQSLLVRDQEAGQLPLLPKQAKVALCKQFNSLSLASQLHAFFEAQALPVLDIRLRWQVVQDILVILRHTYPNCEVYAFGSIITGLSDLKSDIDVYVDLLGETAAGKAMDQPQRISGMDAVQITKRILRKSQCPHTGSWFVKNIIPVTSARVPILKLIHNITSINCDLSFENRLSVQNTKLLRMYLSFDPRIYHFMVLIRYWAKFHNLTGSNLIKNYALTLLVLVYLTKKGHVPTVHFLQKLKHKELKMKTSTLNPDEIDGWDASFCENLGKIKQASKLVPLPAYDPTFNNPRGCLYSHALLQLATDFFEIFANLDFSRFVVCPLLGDFVPKEGFRPGSEETLPDVLDRYKNWAVNQEVKRRFNINTSLCVQDPFVLSFNVGGVTSQGTLLRFQLACAKTLQVLKPKTGHFVRLLDMFDPLPEYIGDKKFMKAYKTEMMAKELAREIKSAVQPQQEEIKGEGVDRSNQISSFVKLPPHLRSFDPFIEERSLKKLTRKGRWELFTDFSLPAFFEDLFITEIFRWEVNPAKRSRANVRENLVALWKQFTEDFLVEFFESALKLFPNEPIETTEPMEDDADGGDDGMDDGKRKAWKPKQLGPSEINKIRKQTETLQLEKTDEELKRLTEKVNKLQGLPGETKYKIVKYIVTYPFWEKRPSLMEEARKQLTTSDMVRIPVLVNTRAQKLRKDRKGKSSKTGKDARGKGTENDDKMMGDEKSGYWNYFNPIDLEGILSQVVTDKFLQGQDINKFNDFNIDVLIKMDTSSSVDRPSVYVIFEKVLECFYHGLS